MPRSTHSAARSARTLDRGPPDAQRAPVFTVGVIGPKRKLRPDGSLLCEDVPIARTGTMFYQIGEVPIAAPKMPGAAPVIRVTRDALTLFAPQALGSTIGAAITIDHPAEDVTPANWKHLSVGYVLDAWRGQGADSELMFADLVITDQNAINRINSEGPDAIREVSLGYRAAYKQTGDGEGRQLDILVNHLALVERGRCGPRCAIGDRDTLFMEGADMPKPTHDNQGGARPRSRLEVARAALEEIENLEDGGDDQHVHVHVHTADRATADGSEDEDGVLGTRTNDAAVIELGERVADLEEGLVSIHATMREVLEAVRTGGTQRTGDADPGAGTGDSAALQTSFQALVAQCEVLVPGYRVPTFDSALPRAKTIDTMCSTRRGVLSMMANTADGKALLDRVTDGELDIEKAPCDQVAIAFKAAHAVKSAANMRTGDSLRAPVAVPPLSTPKRMSIEDVNKANAEYWARQA